MHEVPHVIHGANESAGPLAGIGAAVGAGIALFFSTSLQALAVCGELSYTTEAYRLNGNTLGGLTQNVCSSGRVMPPLELGQIGLNMLVLAVIGGLIGAGIGKIIGVTRSE